MNRGSAKSPVCGVWADAVQQSPQALKTTAASRDQAPDSRGKAGGILNMEAIFKWLCRL